MSVSLQEVERLAAELSSDERVTLVESLLSGLARDENAVAAERRVEIERRLQAWHEGEAFELAHAGCHADTGTRT